LVAADAVVSRRSVNLDVLIADPTPCAIRILPERARVGLADGVEVDHGILDGEDVRRQVLHVHGALDESRERTRLESREELVALVAEQVVEPVAELQGLELLLE